MATCGGFKPRCPQCSGWGGSMGSLPGGTHPAPELGAQLADEVKEPLAGDQEAVAGNSDSSCVNRGTLASRERMFKGTQTARRGRRAPGRAAAWKGKSLRRAHSCPSTLGDMNIRSLGSVSLGTGNSACPGGCPPCDRPHVTCLTWAPSLQGCPAFLAVTLLSVMGVLHTGFPAC